MRTAVQTVPMHAGSPSYTTWPSAGVRDCPQPAWQYAAQAKEATSLLQPAVHRLSSTAQAPHVQPGRASVARASGVNEAAPPPQAASYTSQAWQSASMRATDRDLSEGPSRIRTSTATWPQLAPAPTTSLPSARLSQAAATASPAMRASVTASHTGYPDAQGQETPTLPSTASGIHSVRLRPNHDSSQAVPQSLRLRPATDVDRASHVAAASMAHGSAPSRPSSQAPTPGSSTVARPRQSLDGEGFGQATSQAVTPNIPSSVPATAASVRLRVSHDDQTSPRAPSVRMPRSTPPPPTAEAPSSAREVPRAAPAMCTPCTPAVAKDLEPEQLASGICRHCNQKVTDLKGRDGQLALEAHIRTCLKNPANSFVCEYCSQAFMNAYGIDGRLTRDGKAHFEEHVKKCAMNPGNGFRCEYCGQRFQNKYGADGTLLRDGGALLAEHQKYCSQHPNNNPKCPYCNSRTFVVRYDKEGNLTHDGHSQLREHLKVCPQSPANNHICPHCSKRFQTIYAPDGSIKSDGQARFNEHIQICSKSPANFRKCEYCNFSTTNRFDEAGNMVYDGAADFAAHCRICTKSPANNFTCKYCNETFTNGYAVDGRLVSEGKARLDQHMRVCRMVPANVNKCEYCGMKFPDVYTSEGLVTKGALQLQEHLLVCPKAPHRTISQDPAVQKLAVEINLRVMALKDQPQHLKNYLRQQQLKFHPDKEAGLPEIFRLVQQHWENSCK